MNTRPDLRVVDPETGELHETCPACKEREDVIVGLERDIRGWAARYAELKRDLDVDARDNAMWDDISALVGYWRRRCRHPKSQMTADRFWLIQPFYERHGDAMCRRAIDGAAFDPMTKQRKNGTTERFDGLDLIFRSAEKFESFCNRAPA